MKILIILAHPDTSSFCYAIAERLKEAVEDAALDEETEVLCHSLYEEDFFPVLSLEELKSRFSFDPSVQLYIENLTSCDFLCIIHPDWWGQPPGVLKGWLDRVFRPGVAYEYEGPEFEAKKIVPLLKGKRGCVFITTNLEYSEEHQHYFEELWNRRVFSFCGIETCGIEVCYDMHNSTFGERSRWLENMAALLPRLLSDNRE